MTIKLNVGASVPKGQYRNKEWINLDLYKHNRIQIQGSAFNLPFKNDSFDEIHCVHVLEHVTREKQSLMLSEMRRVIKAECPVYIEVPDIIKICYKMLQAYEAGNYEQARIWTVSMYGKSERSGMAHHWGFNSKYLADKLFEAGFTRSERPVEMISNHYKQEPVLLMKAVK